MTDISELLADHSVALEFVRELASTACEWGCIADHPDEQPCIHCRAAKWLHATKQADFERTRLLVEIEELTRERDAVAAVLAGHITTVARLTQERDAARAELALYRPHDQTSAEGTQ